MDEFFGLLPVLLIYLISAFLSQKKKKNRRRRRQGAMRTSAQGERTDRRKAMRSEQTIQGFETAFEHREAAASQEKPCGETAVHLHEVTQAQMIRAAEGEDPCHAGGFDTGEEETFSYEAQEDDTRSALMQDVLRGVIMSEILTRPDERMTMQRSRRRT